MNEIQAAVKLYRLRIIDQHATAYVVLNSRAEQLKVLDWFEEEVGSFKLRVSGFDDEASRAPITMVISREAISGMILERI